MLTDVFQDKPRGTATPVSKRTRSSGGKGKSKKDESSDEEEEESEDGSPRAGPSGTKGKQAAKEKPAAKGKSEVKTKAKGKGKAKRYFENDWLSSPLNDPSVNDKSDFTRAAEAYDAIPEMMEALKEAHGALKGWLIDNGQLSEDEEEEEEEEDEDEDLFAAYTRKRKRA